MGRCFNQKEMEAMDLVPGTWPPPDPSEWPSRKYTYLPVEWSPEADEARPHSSYAEHVAYKLEVMRTNDPVQKAVNARMAAFKGGYVL